MDVEIECVAEALDQRDRAGVCFVFRIACFLDEERGDGAIGDAEYLANDRRVGGKQKAQLKRDARHPLPHGFIRQHRLYQ